MSCVGEEVFLAISHAFRTIVVDDHVNDDERRRDDIDRLTRDCNVTFQHNFECLQTLRSIALNDFAIVSRAYSHIANYGSNETLFLFGNVQL